MTKIPKLDNAVRVIPNWNDLDGELQEHEKQLLLQKPKKRQQTGSDTTKQPPRELHEEIIS
jgi:hypothetical protein